MLCPCQPSPRCDSLRLPRIIIGVIASLPGISNLFASLLLTNRIWEITGVQLFRHGFSHFFGKFVKAMHTLYPVTSGVGI